MIYIYILELEHDKYYIGRTHDPQFRIELHFMHNGSSWTKKYKPIKVIELIENCNEFDEDKYTLMYMEKFGINNVRGGSFCEIKLSDEHISIIKQMLRGATDKCFICGSTKHFAKECTTKSVKVEQKKEFIDGPCNCATSYFSGHRKSKCALNQMIKYVADFFDDEDDIIDKLKDNKKANIIEKANTIEIIEKTVFQCSYCDKTYDTLKGAQYHENIYCKSKSKK
jgi:hypothetical protein